MKRRRFLAVLLAVSLARPGVALAQQPKPNIILVLMDTFGWGELGVYAGGVLRGAPSRAALMTGRYAIRTGNRSVPIHTPLYGLVQWEYTMAAMLSDAGYATGSFGKWHLGHVDVDEAS